MSERYTQRVLCALATLHLVGCMHDAGDAPESLDEMAAEQVACPMHDADGGTMHPGMQDTDGGTMHPGMQDTDGGTMHGGEHDTDGGTPGGHGEAVCTETHPRYRDGLSAKAGELTVRLVSVAPAPPRQAGANDWVLEVVDAEGKPVPSAVISDGNSFMTVHGHPGRRRPDVVKLEEPGRYLLDNLNFSMRGPWEVSFNVQADASAQKTLAFINICVE